MNKRQYSDGDPGASQPKRLRTSDTDTASDLLWPTDRHGPSQTAQLSNDDYTIAWICALPLELEASRAMLDKSHPLLDAQPGDDNAYILGRVQQHNVVMACLPSGQYGTNSAAIVATDLHRSFRKIRATLLVGIGGGAPSKDHDIRLGDIVVGMRVMQYDMGKNIGDGKFQMTGTPVIPARLLGSTVSTFRSAHPQDTSSAQVKAILQDRLPNHIRPSQPDQLFQATYEHPPGMSTCNCCDPSKLAQRGARHVDGPKIHYGGIASANTVMKNARARDKLAMELSVLCFEMEAAGIMDSRCIPIRGICDYSDSHKNKAWQNHAAAVAAAYARELLGVLPRVGVPDEPVRVQTCFTMTTIDQSSERREQILRSLGFAQLGDRVTTIQRAWAKTCQWFLRHSKYKDWLDPRKQQQTHGFLWIVGKAGAGKSTMMKFAYLKTKNGSKSPGKTIVSFFFNARGSFLERSIAGMYRSLLLQLLNAYPDLQAVLDDPDIIPSNQTDCPDLNILKELFRSAIMSLNRRSFTCFVDALDECDEQEVQDMVEFFRELAQETTEAEIHFRVCFSSRPYPYIYTGTEVLLVLEKEDGHADDLSQYVTSRLRIENPSSLSELKDQILEKAAGIFMWIVLVVDILNRESINGALALKRKLATIPEKLSELFKSILTRDKHDVDRLLLSVLWVLCANRPLSPLEFRHAVWAGLAQDEVDDILKDNSVETAINLVTSSSKGLAEITASQKPTVQFIHESVRDFLIKDNGLREIWPDLGVEWEACAHEKLKNCCDTYLSLGDVQSILQKFELEDRQTKQTATTESFQFLEYACQHILRHADTAAIAISQDDFIDRFITATGIRALNHVGTAKDRLYSSNAPPLYVLADQGLANLVRLQVRRTPAKPTSEKYHHPFFAALAGGHHQSVAALLNLPSVIYDGIDITDGMRRRKDMPKKMNYWGRTPLTWAAQEGKLHLMRALVSWADIDVAAFDGRTALNHAIETGNEAIVGLLLDNGAHVNRPDQYGKTALIHASTSGNENVIQLLLDSGACVNHLDHGGRTALIHASMSGNEAAIQLLIDNDAQVDHLDHEGETALMHASRNRHEAVGRLLVGNGANVLVCEPKYQTTALHLASAAGCDLLVRQLIEKGGANVNASSYWGQTALSEAVRHGNETAARFLITEGGADVNVKDNYQSTALLSASWYGNESMVQLLIDAGADCETRDSSGRTALMRAAASFREENPSVTRLLIQKGAKVDTQDDDGWTALMLASTAGKSDTTLVLLDEGRADINARDNIRWTALMMAANAGKQDVVRHLLVKKADCLAQDGWGRTALSLAQSAGHSAVAQLLESFNEEVMGEPIEVDGA
ncbi:hypothetical protein F5X68DRAFT_152764 [Plectosphaerella plurivora]|uniref:Nucleoside phosphorylase domain-containing protein n=1 Tax=Plectosphaerella plurivora TaxID=936078 RepID=A0A9P8VC05_9PEZI|nr:hypothetical protein F5X68DRAFT_152764 [Plectosphaerella plurivora]